MGSQKRARVYGYNDEFIATSSDADTWVNVYKHDDDGTITHMSIPKGVLQDIATQFPEYLTCCKCSREFVSTAVVAEDWNGLCPTCDETLYPDA